MRAASRALRVLVVSSFALGFFTGCDDEAAQKAEQQKKQLASLIENVEREASDVKATPIATTLKDAEKARALAIELADPPSVAKIDAACAKAHEAQDQIVAQAWTRLEAELKAALENNNPDQAVKGCTDAVASIDRAPDGVQVKYAKELDGYRVQLVARADTAKQAREVLAQAKQLQEASKNLQARAVCRSFEIVDSLRMSPWKPLVTSLMNSIPEKEAQEDLFTVFDGTDEKQLDYFTKEHMYSWKIANNVLFGDSEETGTSESTLWLGDDVGGYSDLILEMRLRVDAVGCNVLVRAAKDEYDKATTFDQVSFSESELGKGAWAICRVVVKGPKVTFSVNGGEQKTLDLKDPKGLLGISLPPDGDVKIQSVKLKILDAGAKALKMKTPEEAPKETDPKGKKGKKKKKPAAATPDPKKDEKKDEKKDGEEGGGG